MHSYIIRRVLLVIPTVILATIIIFLLIRIIPGDMIDAKMAQMMAADTGIVEVVIIDRDMVMRELGLDQPLVVQFGRWVGFLPDEGRFSGILQGDLGVSWWRGMAVTELVSIKWPITLQLSLMALIIAQLIALPIGIYSALRQDKWGDYLGRSFAILCISVPGFWIATLVMVFPSIWWGHMPPLMYVPFIEDPLRNLEMFIVPAIVLGMGMAGMTMRLTRTQILEVMRQDYIRTAWAKGLRERVVILRHVLKNALIPVITLIGLQMPLMVGGAVIIERIFNLPGMGLLMLESLQHRDYPLFSSLLLIFSVFLVLINLVVDLTYGYFDPRVQYK